MIIRLPNKNNILTVIIIFLIVLGLILPTATADTSKIYVEGFDRGVTWKPYIPLKKTTLVHFDKESYIDDYAYLAAIPTAIFYDKKHDQIFTNPLLFYEDEYISDREKERTLNTYQGIDYFMEDWMSYCNMDLDQMTLINIPKSKLNEDWRAKNYTSIDSTDPYELSKEIALADWSYTENAVIAVIEENYEKPDNITYGIIDSSLSQRDGVKTEHFEIPQTNEVYPQYKEFNVPEGYKHLEVRSWYPCFYLELGFAGFEGIVNMSIPAGDRDIQIYCEKDGEWMMAGITTEWNAPGGMDLDKTSVYVYKSGKWSVALTDVPTKIFNQEYLIPTEEVEDTGLEVQKHHKIRNIKFGRYGRIIDILKNMRQVMYNVDIEMYPGVTVEIPETPPFGCRNAQFELSWDDPAAELGFSLIGPSGEEIISTQERGVSTTCHFPAGRREIIPSSSGDKTGMRVERLGECLPGEHYSICVYALNDIKSSTDFTIEYSWEQNFSREEGDCLASATEGAVLASILNAPLLYTSSSEVPSCAVDALYKLGVENIYVVNIGGYLSNSAKNQLSDIATIDEYLTTYEGVYSCIRDLTGRNDVIFSTIDPWSYWYIGDLEVAGEMPNALFIGPAAYIAAHHGSPVLLIDNHPELSSSVVFHNELWRRYPNGITKLPTVSEMYLTGTRVYNFLKELGYDKEGEETIITVAGQFEIGLPWDRIFVGKAMPGRFLGSPTDISVWISKTVFYPQIVFENPAINPIGYELINGSSSKRRLILSRGKFGLIITKPSQKETFQYPVLDTLICYEHKFNSRASKYWGFKYICADGDIPGETASFEPIDLGVMEAVNGQKGGFLADLSGSEVQPFYLKKAGYDPVYSTNFEANMHNLNQGVLLWMINTHGAPFNGGMLMFWDVEGENPQGYPPVPFAGYKKETNPWRGYEWLLGSTEEPDTMTSEIHGVLAALAGNPDPKGIRLLSTALDWAAAWRPIRDDLIAKIASLPILRLFIPDWLQDTQDYYDGIIITVWMGRLGTSWYNGSQIDDSIGNLHSIGVSSVACLPAGKYLHLTMMRHGSVFQIMDPWATSWYSDTWQNGVPRGIALGQTIGEIYSEGISKVGILYITEPPQWWWDLLENVCLYGDPDLRIWTPSTEYSSKNHWDTEDVESVRYNEKEEFYVDGHMPFGADKYPYAQTPISLMEQLIWIVVIVAIFAAVILGVIILGRKRRK